MDFENTNTLTLPVLPLRGLVVFPNMFIHFDVGREKSINALKAAVNNDRRIFLVAQRDAAVAEPSDDDVYKVGVVAEIRQVLKTPDNTTRVLVEGLYRAKLNDFRALTDFYTSIVTPIEEKSIENREIYKETLIRRVKNEFFKYASSVKNKSLYMVVVG